MTATEAASRPPPRQVPRLATIGVVVAVIALAAFADHPAPNRPATATETAMPVAAPAAALSSSWFCAGPVGTPARLAAGRLIVANTASRPLRGRVTLIPSTGPAMSQDLQVEPTSQLVVPEKTAGVPYLGAVVELDGGQAAVKQVIAGAAGTSSTACATSGSTTWYFATGTTQDSATLSLSLLNPYPDDAIADLSFTTEQGQENPQDFQGILVPAGTLVGLDLGTHLRRRASVATTVKLRIGRVAAFETQTVQAQSSAAAALNAPGTAPWPPGATLVRGVPAPGTAWWWPSGATGEAAIEQYVIYNPGAKEAQVSLQPVLDQGSADPFQVTVDPHGVTVLATNTESRVPKGIGHAAALRSTNGVGVVAARLALSSPPASPTGVAVVLGSQLEARRWLVPGNGATEAVTAVVDIYNPGGAPVTVSLSSPPGSLAPLSGQSAVRIPSHQRYLLASGGQGPPATALNGGVVVDASGPVVVESDVTPVKGIGMDAGVGVPLAR